MRFSFLSRKWHKWLALIVGVQALFWLISGVYMVTIHLDYIHGDHLVRQLDEPIDSKLDTVIPIEKMLEQFPSATRIRLVSWLGEPHYRIYGPDGISIVGARDGLTKSPLTEEAALEVATYHFALDGAPLQAVLLNPGDEIPSEIPARALPLWQITFDDAIASTFYISPNDGRLVTRRHNLWRLFDFVWMFHIMDYESREDMNNNLLRLAAFLGITLSLSGLWLLFYSFNKRKKDKSEVLS